MPAGPWLPPPAPPTITAAPRAVPAEMQDTLHRPSRRRGFYRFLHAFGFLRLGDHRPLGTSSPFSATAPCGACQEDRSGKFHSAQYEELPAAHHPSDRCFRLFTALSPRVYALAPLTEPVYRDRRVATPRRFKPRLYERDV